LSTGQEITGWVIGGVTTSVVLAFGLELGRSGSHWFVLFSRIPAHCGPILAKVHQAQSFVSAVVEDRELVFNLDS
jgi:hypothetical protein